MRKEKLKYEFINPNSDKEVDDVIRSIIVEKLQTIQAKQLQTDDHIV